MKGDWRQSIRRGFYPAFVGASIAAHWLLIRVFPGVHPLVLGAPLIFAGLLVVTLAERISPFRVKWNQPDHDLISDFLLTNLLFPIVVGGILFGLRDVFGDKGVWSVWPDRWPLLVQLGAALFVSEFFFYWTHRLSHEWKGLWRFHRVHHTPVRVYWMNSARFHPLDLSLDFAMYFLPLVLLGAPIEIFALLFTLNSATGLLEHANVDFEAAFLNRVFNTAELHRWHHSVRLEESMRNYGKVLSVWDQVFGTYFLPEFRRVCDVGVMPEEREPALITLPAIRPTPLNTDPSLIAGRRGRSPGYAS